MNPQSLPHILKFAWIEWMMIIISGVDSTIGIFVALQMDKGNWDVALPLLGFGVLLTAIGQGVWIRCLHNIQQNGGKDEYRI